MCHPHDPGKQRWHAPQSPGSCFKRVLAVGTLPEPVRNFYCIRILHAIRSCGTFLRRCLIITATGMWVAQWWLCGTHLGTPCSLEVSIAVESGVYNLVLLMYDYYPLLTWSSAAESQEFKRTSDQRSGHKGRWFLWRPEALGGNLAK
jgi:hypothetical protein